jgi:hypothetical protein
MDAHERELGSLNRKLEELNAKLLQHQRPLASASNVPSRDVTREPAFRHSIKDDFSEGELDEHVLEDSFDDKKEDVQIQDLKKQVESQVTVLNGNLLASIARNGR